MGGYSVHLDDKRFKVIKNILLLAFVGLSCCKFLVGETCSKGGNNGAVMSTKYGVIKCLGYNSRHMDSKLRGFNAGMLRVCMLGQYWDLPKEL
jgi:hypothetical protein